MYQESQKVGNLKNYIRMSVPLFLSAYPRCNVLVGVGIRLLFIKIIILDGFYRIFEERTSHYTNKKPLITRGFKFTALLNVCDVM
jgi:hypothetical protein